MPAKKSTRKVAAAKSTAKKSTISKRTAGAASSSAKSPQKPSGSVGKTTVKKAINNDIQNSSSFAKAESKAKEYAKDPKKLHKLFEDAAEKAKETPKGPFGETWAYFQAMIRLIRAYANGTYRTIPIASLLLILVAVIYFVSPLDFIPDFIPVAGFIDDALVISLALKQVKADLDAFMEWEVEANSTKK